MAPIGLALVEVGAGMGGILLLASAMDVSPSAVPIAGIVGLGVGIDYALFIVARYRENRAAGRDNGTALADAMSSSGSAVVFAGGTVVIAMASLAVIGLGALTSIGLATAIVVLSAVAAAITLLPALLGLLGDRIDTRPAGRTPPSRQARRGDRLVAFRPPSLGTPLALPGRRRVRPPCLRRPGSSGCRRRGRLRVTPRATRRTDRPTTCWTRASVPASTGPWLVVVDLTGPGVGAADVPELAEDIRTAAHRLGQRAADLRGRQHRGLRGDADDGSCRSRDLGRHRRGA